MMRRAIASRPAAAMAAATGLSRATGLLRTVALATALGVSVLGDSYNTANTVPNMVFTLVAGGILTSAVVPVLVAERTEAASTEAAGVLLGVTLAAGAAASVVLGVAAPAVIRLLTSSAASRAGYDEYLALTTTWLRWFAPQVGLYAVGVLAVSIMTARRRLFLGAAAPILTNIVTLAVAVAVLDIKGLDPGKVSTSQVALLGAGTTLAVGAATMAQLWGAYRSAPGLRLRWQPGHRAVRSLAGRGGWMVLYVAANQIGLSVIIAIATVTPGGVSAYQWAFILMQLPYALVSVSIVSASYAEISRAAHIGRSVDRLIHRAGSSSLQLLIPSAVGLAIVGPAIASVVVGADDAPLLAAAVVGFGISLVPFSLFQLLTRVCYAHRDTRTPALTNIAVNTVNVAAAVLLVSLASSPAQRLGALALAHGVSYVAGVGLLASVLVRRGVISWASLLGGQRRTLVAASLMGGALLVSRWLVGETDGRAAAMGAAGGSIVLGAVVFVLGSGGFASSFRRSHAEA